MNYIWYFYLTSAAITHLIGLAVYMKGKPPGSWSFLKEAWHYYTEGPEAALVSIGTFSIVWVLGSIYIDKLAVSYFGILIALPCHPAIAVLLGFMGEFFGPRIIKVVYKWFVPGGD
jgi:hypothetical protein